MKAIHLCLALVAAVPIWGWAAGENAWSSDNPDVVCGAIHGLLRDDTDASRAILLSLLEHAHPAVRQEAAYAFCQSPWVHALPKLMDLAAHDADEMVRACAVMALGESREARCLPLLRSALTDPSRRVRERAAMALQHFDDMESAEPLLNAIRDQDAEVVFNAAFALGRRKGDRIVRSLLPLLERPERKIRVAAADSIGRIVGQRHLASDPLLQTAEGGALLRKQWEARFMTDDARSSSAAGGAGGQLGVSP